MLQDCIKALQKKFPESKRVGKYIWLLNMFYVFRLWFQWFVNHKFMAYLLMINTWIKLLPNISVNILLQTLLGFYVTVLRLE